MKREANLESRHVEPEFREMVAEIEADMASQLAELREMEKRGEIAAIPGDEASIH